MANEPSSDYGYDLVHGDLTRRDLAGEDAPAPRSPGAPPADRQGRPPDAESTGDHGYDEAHDF